MKIDTIDSKHTTKNTLVQKQAKIEEHPAWKNLEFSQVNDLLKDQKPYTYVISSTKMENQYCLSYVSKNCHDVIQVQFHKSPNGTYGYENMDSSSGLSIDHVIKRIMHIEPTDPEPIPLQKS